jgi:hypothetical protein
MEESPKIVEMAPEKLGKLMVEIDMDTNRYHIGFTDPDVAKLLNQVEQVNIFSPFHAACIINELRRRMEGRQIKPAKGLIIH